MKSIQLASITIALALIAPAAWVQTQPDLGVNSDAVIGDPSGPTLDGAELDRRTEELASLMRCPVCQGLSIADSPTLLAMAMKSEVRQFLAAGYSEDQIINYFEQSYGEFIRLEPKAEGFNLVVWIAPVAALLLGIAIVVRVLRKSKRTHSETNDAEKTDDLASYRQRVRQEVNR